MGAEVVGGHCKEAREFYQDSTVLLDADNLSFDSFERAVCHFDCLTFTELLGNLCEVDEVFVLRGSHGDEVFHSFLRDGEGSSGCAVPVVVHRRSVAEGADEIVKLVLGAESETKVADGRDELAGDPRSSRG